MNCSFITKTIAAAALAFASLSAQSAVIFEDNFDSENGGVGKLNYTNFDNWVVGNGTVDLIGNGFHGAIAGHGLYIDLDGSTTNAGVMYHLEELDQGDYTLFFDLAGNQRDANIETTEVKVSVFKLYGFEMGSAEGNEGIYSLTQNEQFQTFSLDFSVNDWSFMGLNSVLEISFGALGGDNIGMLLDNVRLETRVATAVSEPSSLGILGLGIIGLGAMRRRMKKA